MRQAGSECGKNGSRKSSQQLFLPLLLILALTFALLIAAAGANDVAKKELQGEWQGIAISEDMVGKSLAELKGDCSIIEAWGVYDAKKTPSEEEGKWVRLHWDGDSRKIAEEMVGYGLWVYTAQGIKCTLGANGVANYLGKASKLTSAGLSWNFISVSKGMAEKSLSELKGTCEITKATIYNPEACRQAAQDQATSCVGDYEIIDLSTKLSPYLGEALWVKVAADCMLNDGTPAEVLCKESECAAKNGCYGNEYKTFSCRNKECIEISKRECTSQEAADAEVKKGINLMPTGAEVFPKVESFPATIQTVIIKVKNSGKGAAVADKQFLETNILVLKGETEICRDMRRDLIAISAGTSAEFMLSPKPVSGSTQEPCRLDDKNANYWVVAEVDTLKIEGKPKGVIKETNEEDNKQTFQIKEQPSCSPLGKREGTKYCSIPEAKWRDQKDAGQQCSYHFECKTDMCILEKCVSEEKKAKILEILRS